MLKKVEGKTILYLGNKLQSKGYNPTLIDLLSLKLSEEGFRVFAYSSKKNKSIRLFEMLLAIIKHHKKVDCALIDTYSTSAFYFAYISAKLLKFINIPYITILHGGNLPKRYLKDKRKLKWLLLNAKTNVTPSDYLYNFFIENGITQLKKIPNFLEIKRYKFKLRSNLKLNLIWVRAFAEIYKPLQAIKTLELLLHTFPKATLSMVGPVKDHSFESCKNYVDTKNLPVTFTGQLSKAQWLSYADKFDIFINTTTVDNTPVSVIEAMALGMLVVSTNVGGLPYLIENEKNGILVNPTTNEEMVNAIKKLKENKEFSKSLSLNARKKAEEFSWDIVKEKWLEVLN